MNFGLTLEQLEEFEMKDSILDDDVAAEFLNKTSNEFAKQKKDQTIHERNALSELSDSSSNNDKLKIPDNFKKRKIKIPKDDDLNLFGSDDEDDDGSFITVKPKSKNKTKKPHSIDNKTLDVKNSKKKSSGLNGERSTDYGRVNNYFSSNGLTGFQRDPDGAPPKVPVIYIPPEAIQSSLDGKSCDCYSSCDEFESSDDDDNFDRNNKRNEFQTPKIKQSDRLKKIFQNKSGNGESNKSKSNKNNSSKKPKSNKFSDIDADSDNDEIANSSSQNSKPTSGTDDVPIEKLVCDEIDKEISEEEILEEINNAHSEYRSARDNFNRNAEISKFESIDMFIKIAKSRKKQSKICFGCMFGSVRDDEIELAPLKACVNLIETHYGTTSDDIYVAKLVHVYYMANIYNPMKNDGKNIPRWRTRDILVHINEHVKHPTIFLCKQLKKYGRLSNILYDMTFKTQWVNGQEFFMCDTRNLKALLDVDKKQMELYKSDPKQMLFYSGNAYNIDTNAIGRIINMNKNFVVRKKK